MAKAIFAGGCFWCMVQPFDSIFGINSVISGYTGGVETSPSYDEVYSGKTGHCEAVQIDYNPNLITYGDLLDIYWSILIPDNLPGEFHETGSSYRNEIFYTNLNQKKLAENSLKEQAKKGRFSRISPPKITKASRFWPAEDIHQNFYKKSPARYKDYSIRSGRTNYYKNSQERKNA